MALAGLGRTGTGVVALRYFADLSEVEMAESMGCPVGTVKLRAEPGPRPPAGLDLDGGPAVDPSTQGPSHADLEVGLRDLGTHLDVGSAAVVDVVVARLADKGRPTDRRLDPRRLLQLGAAILVVTLAGLAALPPTREAIADCLGVGGVASPRPTGLRRPDGPTTAVADPPADGRDDAAADLSFDVRRAGPGAGRARRGGRRPSGGHGPPGIRYRALRWSSWRRRRAAPALDKFVGGGTSVRPATVDGHEGFWLTASHTRSALSAPTAGSMRTPSAGPATCSSGRTPA